MKYPLDFLETKEIKMIESRCGILCSECNYSEQGDDSKRIKQCKKW